MQNEHPNKPTQINVVDVSGQVHEVKVDSILYEDQECICIRTGIGDIQLEKCQNEGIKKSAITEHYRQKAKRNFRGSR